MDRVKRTGATIPKRPAIIVMSDWLANCSVGQWTPFEAADALKKALAKEGYEIVPAGRALLSSKTDGRT